MSSELPFEIVLISVLAFASVLVFARFHESFGRSEMGAENNEPSTNMSGPNRRNQSATSLQRRLGVLVALQKHRNHVIRLDLGRAGEDF